MKIYKTKYDFLGVTKQGSFWRFVDIGDEDDKAVVGPPYPTKKAALADIESVAAMWLEPEEEINYSLLNDVRAISREAGQQGVPWDTVLWEVHELIEEYDEPGNIEAVIDHAHLAYDHGVRNQLLSTAQTYYTTAPLAYDAENTITVGTVGRFEGRLMREVAIQPLQKRWQLLRYESGGYALWTPDQLEEFSGLLE